MSESKVRRVAVPVAVAAPLTCSDVGCDCVQPKTEDPVNHPSHYTNHPSGVEAITVCEHFNFNIGNAIKYLWRAGLKGKQLEDLKKAAWYVNREIERLNKVTK